VCFLNRLVRVAIEQKIITTKDVKIKPNEIIVTSGCSESSVINCGRKAIKKSPTFGLRIFITRPRIKKEVCD
jgi:hypothetical protein